MTDCACYVDTAGGERTIHLDGLVPKGGCPGDLVFSRFRSQARSGLVEGKWDGKQRQQRGVPLEGALGPTVPPVNAPAAQPAKATQGPRGRC